MKKKICSNLNFSMYIWLHIKYSIYELIFLHVCFFSVWFCSWPQGSKHNKAQVKPLLAKRKALHFAKRCSNLTEKMACKEDQSRIISLKRGFVPENPVCDSGIFCYGKKFLKISKNFKKIWIFFWIFWKKKLLKVRFKNRCCQKIFKNFWKAVCARKSRMW